VGASFVAAASETLRSISIPFYQVGSADGDSTYYICDDDDGKPTAIGSCTAFGSFDSALPPAINSVYEDVYQNIYNATGKAVTATNTYWLVDGGLYSGDDSASLTIPYNSAGTGAIFYSGNGSAWTQADASAQFVRRLGACAYGTGETPVQGLHRMGSGYVIGSSTNGRYKLSGSFTASENYCLKKVAVPIGKVGTPPGTVSVKLQASDKSDIATATETLTESGVTDALVWYEFNFSSCQNLTLDTVYRISVETSAIAESSGNYFIVGQYSSGGNSLDGYTSSWTQLDSSAGISKILYK
jgi:hypothetical protein